MKKINKMLFGVLCTSFLTSTLFIENVSAESTETLSEIAVVEGELENSTKFNREEVIKNLKVNKSVTETQINNLNDAMIYELSKDSGEIVSVSEQDSILNSPNSIEGEISIMQMPSKDFKMTVVAQRIYEKSGDNFKFIATGDWIKNPFWEFKDTIALGWSDNFTLYSDYSYMYGYDAIGAQTLYPGTRNSVKAETGVGHYVTLRPSITDDKAVLVAKVYKNNSSGTANVVGEYAHVELSASVTGISFGAGGGSAPTIGFSVDWNSRYNEAIPGYDYFSY